MNRITFETVSSNGPYTSQELMATAISRRLKDGETVGTGAASALARAACRLAQLTHAPSLAYVAGGSGAVNSELAPLVASSGDYTNLICEAVIPMGDFIGGLTKGRVDVFIASGLQIDKFGNVNLSLIGDPAKPQLRGPGGALLPMFASAKHIIYFFPDHSPRTFVEKVSFRTAPGFLEGVESWNQAKQAGSIKGEGPLWVVTNLAVMDFDPDTKAMRLISLHPGVSLEQAIAATGFQLVIPPRGAVTAAPTTQELEILHELDEQGLLRQ